MRFAVIFLLVLPVAAVKTGNEDTLGLEVDESSDADLSLRPVMKVVKLLQDMGKQLATDLQDDKEVHEKMDCWCETNEKEKTQAIEQGDIKIQSLKASLGEAAGQMGELKVKRKETWDELQKDKKALSDAGGLRIKEQEAFGKDQSDTAAALAASKNAVVVLSKHNPALLEVRRVARGLDSARVLQMGIVNNLKQAAIKNFMTDAQSATSFLAIPGFQSQGGQSGQIFGILSQMVDDFQDHLKEIQDQEAKAASDYQGLKSAKEGQIADGEKQTVDLDKRLGATSEKSAQDELALKGAEEQLEADTKFLASLREKCSEGDKEYDIRVKDRMTEIEAVEKAIRVLNDEDSFKLFGKTVDSFLQISSAATEKEQMRRQSAAATLERAAAEANSPALAMIAGRVRLDAFKEVKKAIEGMVAELDKQQADEIEHKDWCVKEQNENTRDNAAAEDKKDTLTVSRNSLKSAIETFNKQIEDAHAEVKEMKVQMKRASETREGANAAFQQSVNDQRMTQMVLNKARTTLAQVYALVQNSHRGIRLTGEPPAKFKNNAGKNAGGSAVLLLLDGIIADSKKAEADAIAGEQNAQTTYESFMTDSNKALTQKAEEIMTLSGNRATSKEDLNMAQKDLAATDKKLSNLEAEKEDLAGSCNFIMDNFEKRQTARAAETDALKEAMAILSGAKS